jgi:hypothetical protein
LITCKYFFVDDYGSNVTNSIYLSLDSSSSCTTIRKLPHSDEHHEDDEHESKKHESQNGTHLCYKQVSIQYTVTNLIPVEKVTPVR